jgi:hypothetical protein
MDGSAVFINAQFGPYITELILGLLAVLDIIIIRMLRQPDPEEAPPPNQPPGFLKPNYSPPQVEETPDNLEKTRYQ